VRFVWWHKDTNPGDQLEISSDGEDLVKLSIDIGEFPFVPFHGGTRFLEIARVYVQLC
jgi:hypothetical protein